MKRVTNTLQFNVAVLILLVETVINLFFTFEAEVKMKPELMINQPNMNADNLKTYPIHVGQNIFGFAALPIDDTSVMRFRVRVLFFSFPSFIIGKVE